MGKETLKSRQVEKKTPRESFIRKKKNASGGVDAKFLSCKECGVEFCTGESCKIFDYDTFKRISVTTVQTVTREKSNDSEMKDKKLFNKQYDGIKVKGTTKKNTKTLKKKITNADNKIITVKTVKRK